MKLKTIQIEGKTYAEVADGKPVYDADGKDIAYDVPAAVAKITALNGEAMGHREAKEAAEAKLKQFEGITDPVAARKALETVSSLDSKDLIAAEKVDEIKAAAIAAAQAKLDATIAAKDEVIKAVTVERDTFVGQLNRELIGGSFSRSGFVKDKLSVPSDMAQAMFGPSFKVEDGKVVAYDKDKNPIWSTARPGEKADFEEAMEKLVDAYPNKNSIIRGVNQNGSGARPGQELATATTMTTAELNSLPPKARAERMAKGVTLTE